MKLWVAVTDNRWFEQLAGMAPDEVNFWQPSGTREFRVLQPGELFLFKLHAPRNFIVGGGYFVRYSALPASLAWDAFGLKNGVMSFPELRARIRQFTKKTDSLDPIIGCNVLVEPFFFPESEWLPVPASFARNIVQGKTYRTEDEDGASLWAQVQDAMRRLGDRGRPAPAAADYDAPRFGEAYLTRGRLGQGAFRILVTDAYNRRCAVTGEKTLPVLEAAHIKPYAEQGPHRVSNGILLRSDLHKLFDLGYITITPDLRLEVSRRLREEWHNGREYYAYAGKPLQFHPNEPARRPASDYLAWHNENCFKP